MQPLKEFFPWAEFYAGPGLLHKDFYGPFDWARHSLGIQPRVHFPKVLPDVRDIVPRLEPEARALFDAIWFHMAGLDWNEREILSSIEVPAWADLN